jgi:hypothetical protein
MIVEFQLHEGNEACPPWKDNEPLSYLSTGSLSLCWNLEQRITQRCDLMVHEPDPITDFVTRD